MQWQQHFVEQLNIWRQRSFLEHDMELKLIGGHWEFFYMSFLWSNFPLPVSDCWLRTQMKRKMSDNSTQWTAKAYRPFSIPVGYFRWSISSFEEYSFLTTILKSPFRLDLGYSKFNNDPTTGVSVIDWANFTTIYFWTSNQKWSEETWIQFWWYWKSYFLHVSNL